MVLHIVSVHEMCTKWVYKKALTVAKEYEDLGLNSDIAGHSL